MKSKIERMKIDARIISDPNVFRISYTPPEILERKETIQLYDELAPFVSYRNPNNILVVGYPGTGKTVTANFIARNMPNLESSIDVQSINCNGKEPNQILSILVSGVPTKDMGFDDLLAIFLTDTIKKDTLIVLDEVDKGQKIYPLLYALSRPNELVPTFKLNISLLLISNNLYWEEELPAYLRSSLQLRKLVFAPCNYDQLKAILAARIKNGFLNESAMPEELLDAIINKTIKHREGDCRVALKTVFLAAKSAEQKLRDNIIDVDIKTAFDEAVQEIESNRLLSLNHNHFIALLSSFSNKLGLENLYEQYLDIFKNASSRNWNSLKMTNFYHAIDYLDSQGLVKKEIKVIKKEGEPPTRELRVRPNIQRDIVVKEFEKRITKIESKDIT